MERERDVRKITGISAHTSRQKYTRILVTQYYEQGWDCTHLQKNKT